MTLALPLTRFYTRSVYFDMSSAEREERENVRGLRLVERNEPSRYQRGSVASC